MDTNSDGLLSGDTGWNLGDGPGSGADSGGADRDGGGSGGDSGSGGDGSSTGSDGGAASNPFQYTQLAILNYQWTPSGVGSLSLLDMTALQADPRCGTDNAPSACNVNGYWYGFQIGGNGAPLSASNDGGPMVGCAFPRLSRALVAHNYQIGVVDTGKPLSDIASTGANKALSPPLRTTWYTSDINLPIGPNNGGTMDQLHGLPVDIFCDQSSNTAFVLNDGRWETYAEAIFALAWDGSTFGISRLAGLSSFGTARPNGLAADDTRGRLSVAFDNSKTLVHVDRKSGATTSTTLDRFAGNLIYSPDGRYAYVCNCTKAGNPGNGYLAVYDAGSFTRLGEISTTYSSTYYVPDGTGPSQCFFAADWADNQLWATFGGCGSNGYGRVVRFDIKDPAAPVANDYRYGQSGQTYPSALIYDPVPHPQQTSASGTVPITTVLNTRVYVGFYAPTSPTNAYVTAYLAKTGDLTYFNGTSATDFSKLGNKFPGSTASGRSYFWVR